MLGEDLADGEAEEAVHPAHPVGVARGQVVVDGDDVHAVAGQRVEVRRQRRDQGLALTGLHLGDVAEVQRRAAHELHLVVELAQGAARRLADDGERLGQQVVEGLAVGVALLERVGQRAQLGVGEIDVVVFERLDVIGDGRQTTDHLAFTGAQKSWQEPRPQWYGHRRTIHDQSEAPPARRPQAGDGQTGWAAWHRVGMGEWRGNDLRELTLDGPRLHLRRFRDSDIPAVFAAMQHPVMHEFLPLPDPYTLMNAEEFVREISEAGRIAGTAIEAAVVERGSGRLVGSCALRLPAPRQVGAEIGYGIYPAGQGHGYAAEASRLVTDWAFGHGIARVQIRAAVQNLASIRTAVNAGFVFEGIERSGVLTRRWPGGRRGLQPPPERPGRSVAAGLQTASGRWPARWRPAIADGRAGRRRGDAGWSARP